MRVRLRVGDRVLAFRLRDGPQMGEVVEVLGPIWDRWYGVQIGSLNGEITYYLRRRDLVRLTSS